MRSLESSETPVLYRGRMVPKDNRKYSPGMEYRNKMPDIQERG